MNSFHILELVKFKNKSIKNIIKLYCVSPFYLELYFSEKFFLNIDINKYSNNYKSQIYFIDILKKKHEHIWKKLNFYVNIKNPYENTLSHIFLKYLKNIKSNIISLNLHDDRYIMDNDLMGMDNLKELILPFNMRITDKGLYHIGNSIESISFFHNNNITDEGILHCKKLKKLIMIYNDKITNNIFNNNQFEYLNIGWNENIDDDGLINQKNLECFISYCNEDITIDGLINCKNLKHFLIYDIMNISDYHYKQLKSLFKKLDIKGCMMIKI
jgi:hypothetical protein